MKYATNEQILDRIGSIPDRVTDKGNAPWTRAVKQAFGELGHDLGWTVCAGGMPDIYEHEWLFDLVWYRDGDAGLHGLGLVLESEWSPRYKDIRYDFEKLLIARAPTKIMVFEAYEPDARTFLDRMTASINAYEDGASSETYYLACYYPPDKKFIVETVQKTWV